MTTEWQTCFFEEPVPSPFDFESTASAHGWAALRPFKWNASRVELYRVHRLSSGKVVRLQMREENGTPEPSVRIGVDAVGPLTPDEEGEVRRIVRRMLRLDESLAGFDRLRSQLNVWKLRLPPGGGRLLRCPTLFEDIVYTLCTTNIAWSGTIRMVDRLVTHLGEPVPGNDDGRAFPTAEAIAGAGPDFLRQETGLGYRSDYVWELAAAVAEERLDLQIFEDPDRPTEKLEPALRQLKGVGPYAAATILMILGRYEHLAIDSEMRAFVSKKYFAGQPPSDDQIRSIYAPWGRWQYLAYWFDSPA